MALSIHRAATGAGLALAHLRSGLLYLAILVMSLGHGAAILLYFHWRRTPERARWLLTTWSAGFVGLARWITGIRHVWEGREKIPPGPVIYVVNHQSLWESIAWTVFVRDVNIVTKRELMAIPVFGWGLRHAPMIPVYRDQPGRNLRRLLREGTASLAAGRSVLIFPEGTRLAVGARRPFARGFEALYARAGVPIVPVVHNSGLVWPKGFAAKRAGTITLRVLDPIPPGRSPAEVAAELEARIDAEKDRLPGVGG